MTNLVDAVLNYSMTNFDVDVLADAVVEGQFEVPEQPLEHSHNDTHAMVFYNV